MDSQVVIEAFNSNAFRPSEEARAPAQPDEGPQLGPIRARARIHDEL